MGMFGIKTRFEKNITKQVRDAFPREVEAIVGLGLMKVFEKAQTIIPRDTNYMATTGQISHERGEMTGEVTYYADYSSYVHEGTPTQRSQPWLRQSSDRVEKQVIAAFRQLESRLPH